MSYEVSLLDENGALPRGLRNLAVLKRLGEDQAKAKAKEKLGMKKTIKDYLTEKAFDEAFAYARQRQCVHDQRLYVGFKTTDMRQVYIQPDMSQECQFIADVTARYVDRLVSEVEVHRIITKKEFEDEERAERQARRASAQVAQAVSAAAPSNSLRAVV
jgi:hypothetical protein